MIDYHRLKMDLLAIGLLAATVFMALSLFSHHPADSPSTVVFPLNAHPVNLCGPVGAKLSLGLRETLGFAAWGLLGIVLFVDLRLFSRRPIPDPYVRGFGCLLLIASLCLTLQLLVPMLPGGPIIGSGGYLGAWGRKMLADHFSVGGSWIAVVTLFVAGMVLSTEAFLFRMLYRLTLLPLRLTARLLFGRPARMQSATAGLDDQPLVDDGDGAEPPIHALALNASTGVAGETPAEQSPGELAAEVCPLDEEVECPSPVQFKVNPPIAAAPLGRSADAKSSATVGAADHTPYELPDLSLLEDSEEFPFELLAKKAQQSAAILEKTFQQFGLNVKVSEIDTGPVVTQFELDLEPGLRVSKVTALQDDLAIALRVPAVRVVSPIPGKNTVGVEVPNDKRVMVRLRELVEACRPQAEKMAIPIFLGKDVSGHPLIVDMAKMPHLLIAGRTGTGKSVCLNTLIVSMLMSRTPDDVRMLMIDPKMVELSPYMKIPHLMHPVITDMKKAEAVLAWAVDKMEERYDVLARCGVRHLDSYNKLGKEKVLDRMGIDADDPEADDIPEKMPYIVIIADEMADMIMTSGKDVEGHIIRLAQKSRAVGIHLVLATQKPTVDVITGLIKSNLPARISFQVASRVDSRVVLDECGAERLLGNGDMLYLAPGTSSLTRAQGTYVSDDEVNSVIEFYSDYAPQYSAEIAQATSAAAGGGGAGGGGLDAIRERDELYAQAVEVCIREGRGSVSLIQRALGVGYGRAARMVDYMAEDGIVGAYNGSKHRDVVVTMEQWEALRAGAPLEEAC